MFIELIANYHRFGTKQVLMKQKSGKDYKITDIGEVARGLLSKGINPQSLPLLHALSGCDSTSYPFGIGKTTAWGVYKEFHHLLDSVNYNNPSSSDYDLCEKFMCRLFKERSAEKLDSIRMKRILT